MSARDWDAETGRDIVRACRHLDGALLPVLRAPIALAAVKRLAESAAAAAKKSA